LSIFSEVFVIVFSFEIALVIDIVIGVLWVPVGVAHLVFLHKVVLWSPHFLRAEWIFLGWERSVLLRNIHLILSHQVMNTGIHLVLEEGVRHTEIVVWMNSDWQLTRNWIPWVLMLLPDWGITEGHHGHFIISSRWPKNLNLLSLGIGNNLPAKVCLVSLVEDINTIIDYDISEINFLLWGEAHLLDSQCFLSGETWCSSHQFLDIGRLRSVVPWTSHLTVHLSDIFHCVWSVIWWDWT